MATASKLISVKYPLFFKALNDYFSLLLSEKSITDYGFEHVDVFLY